MSCGENQLIMFLQLVLFVVLYTTISMQYSYGSLALTSNTNQHFDENNNSRFVTLDQLSAYVVMDLTGSTTEGSYRVTLNLGQHAQPYSFLIDTGSELTWVNCQLGSREYQYPHPPYKPSVRNPVVCGDPICRVLKHPTEHPCRRNTDKCYYFENYADGTNSSGDIIIDYLALPFRNVEPSHQRPSIKMGCGLHNHHPSRTVAHGRVAYDGILGLAKRSIVTILDQLDKKGTVVKVFGHCIARPRDGYFFIGAGKPLPSGITWAPMQTLPNEKHYSLGHADITFNGDTMAKNLQTIFYSGSTFTYFKHSAHQTLLRAVKGTLLDTPLTAVEEKGYPICWRHHGHPIRTVEEVAAYFKTITLTFQAVNKQYQVPPYAYLTVRPRGNVCFTIMDASRFGLGDLNLIGGTFFQGKVVVYDLNRMRIGWAPSNCENRGMREHLMNREYHLGDVPRHHFSSNIPVQWQFPLDNYTAIHQTMK